MRAYDQIVGMDSGRPRRSHRELVIHLERRLRQEMALKDRAQTNKREELSELLTEIRWISKRTVEQSKDRLAAAHKIRLEANRTLKAFKVLKDLF